MTLQLEPTPEEREAMAILDKGRIVGHIKFWSFVAFVLATSYLIGWVAITVQSRILNTMGF